MSDPTRDERTVPPKSLPQDTASSADEHTAGLPPPASSDDDFSFLEKPQTPDELGWLDHFRILKELGRGGMGCVLLAEDTKLDRPVALKVMLPQYAKNATAKERFLREAKAAAKIRHDHVIAILQVGEANGVPYIAMDYLKGSPLDKYLKDKGDLPLPTVLRIGREIALGLAEAHKLGMIHRDIKPANIWLEAPKGRVKILDFGLARREVDGEAHLTQSGAIVGTPAYMAPEQASGEKLDGRADLFSLGVLLYRLTTGQAAFTGPTTTAMLLQVMTHEPSLASEVKPTVPLEMARIIAKLMAKKREERYGSTAEFLADWERLMRSPKAEAATQPKPSEPRPSGSGNRVAAEDSAPLPDGRSSTGRWLALGVVGLLMVSVALWFLIPRDTPPVEPKKTEEPPVLNETNAKEVQAAWAAKLNLPVESTSPTGIKMMLIPPGSLVKYPYLIGKYEVTQDEWQKVMGYNPSSSTKAANCPVENVTWYDCVEFCNKLSEQQGLPAAYELTPKLRKGSSIEEAAVKILGGPGYRIPTDPEWEHACLAGSKGKYCFGDNDVLLVEYAWYDHNSGKKTHSVGELKPNGFGLYDMHGNVLEWNEETVTNTDTGAVEWVVRRGGHWAHTASYSAVGPRNRSGPALRGNINGLRLVRVPSAKLASDNLHAIDLPQLNATNAAKLQAAWAAKLKVPVEEKSSTGIAMMLIPPGELVPYPYLMGKYEVTQAEWQQVMGQNPSWFAKGRKEVEGSETNRFPVDQVSWYDSLEFCNKLSENEGLKAYYEVKATKRGSNQRIVAAEVTILGGSGYHIPTDAEWEHACRAGSKTKYHFGDKDEQLAEYGWFKDNSNGRTHEVGGKKPNNFGLYDIHGNVGEWNEEMPPKKEGAAEGVYRGGSFSFKADQCALGHRSRSVPAYSNHNYGLRLARVP